MAGPVLDNLDDALEATSELLTPISLRQWAKLALVAFFIAGPGANLNTFNFNFPADNSAVSLPAGAPTLPDIGPEFVALIAVIVALVAAVVLLFVLIGSIMEFVFIEALRTETVRVREFWGRRWRQGLRLFGFRLVVGLIVLGSVAGFIGIALLPFFSGEPGASIVGVILLMPFLIALVVFLGVLNGFTTVFVVPIMILEDCGVITGWRRLWSSIRVDPWPYLAYAFAGFLLSLAGGIVVAIGTIVLALVLLLPFGLLGLLSFGVMSIVAPLGTALLAVLVALFILAILVGSAVVQVPVLTYLRYYALLVLGDIDEELDLIPELRAAIRD